MAEKKIAAAGSGSKLPLLALGGAGLALGVAYFMLAKKQELQGTMTFQHKGLGVEVWAGIGLAPAATTGRNAMKWEAHQSVMTANSVENALYTVDVKESLPKELEKGTYDLWAFVHNAVGPIDMDIETKVGQYLQDPTGIPWYLTPNVTWLFWNITLATPGYIMAKCFEDAVKVEGSLL